MKNPVRSSDTGVFFFLTPLEKLGLFIGFAFLLFAAFAQMLYPTSVLSAIFVNGGTGILAAVMGSILKDWRWRSIVDRYEIDPHVIVHVRREAAGYARILEHIRSAEEVDIMGISLQYVIEYIKDFPVEVDRKTDSIRILLPGDPRICDDRDIAQGSPLGSTRQDLKDSIITLELLKQKIPSLLNVRFFTIQPYLALTRVDEIIWVSPYVTKSGRSCPVLKISRHKSPDLFTLFKDHFETIWRESKADPPQIDGSHVAK